MRYRSFGVLTAVLIAMMTFTAMPALAGGGGYMAPGIDAMSVSVDTVPVFKIDTKTPGFITTVYITTMHISGDIAGAAGAGSAHFDNAAAVGHPLKHPHLAKGAAYMDDNGYDKYGDDSGYALGKRCGHPACTSSFSLEI